MDNRFKKAVQATCVFIRMYVAIFCDLALAACTGAGPRGANIKGSEDAVTVFRETGQPFALISVNEDVAKFVTDYPKEPAHFPQTSRSGPVVLGVGDTVAVSIVTTDNGGFVDFTTASVTPVATTTLPQQTIRETGNINVAPIGVFRAQGLTVAQLERGLTRKLSEVLVEPTVIVELIERQSQRVYVVGAVAGAGRVSLTEVDTRLVDVITASGGPAGRLEDLEVLVSRSGQTFRAPLDEVFENPRLNIHLRPDDVITVQPPERKVIVLGATGNETLRFDEPDVTLTELIGQSGGLDNRRASRLGVFVYRRINRELAAGLDVPLDEFGGADIPAIFTFNFTEPTVYFTSSKWTIEEGDVLYISDNFVEEIGVINTAINALITTPLQLANIVDD